MTSGAFRLAAGAALLALAGCGGVPLVPLI